MSKPLIIIDLETTGLNPTLAAPIAIACLVLGGPHHDATFHRRFRPFVGAEVNPFAMQVNGYDELEIWNWPDPARACVEFISWIDDVCPAPNVVTPAGWNYRFDEGFLQEWILRHVTVTPDVGAYYGNTFAAEYQDGMAWTKEVYPDYLQRFPRKGGLKLTYQYEHHFGVAYKDAHTELADCYATRQVMLACDKLRKEPQYAEYHHLLDPTP